MITIFGGDINATETFDTDFRLLCMMIALPKKNW